MAWPRYLSSRFLSLFSVIKTAAIRDIPLFEKLEKEAAKVLAKDPEILTEIIVKCATIKAQVVEEDDKESGIRCILNFGHTIGHAIEGTLNDRVHLFISKLLWNTTCCTENVLPLEWSLSVP